MTEVEEVVGDLLPFRSGLVRNVPTVNGLTMGGAMCVVAPGSVTARVFEHPQPGAGQNGTDPMNQSSVLYVAAHVEYRNAQGDQTYGVRRFTD